MTNQYLEEKVFELEKRVEKIELSNIISDLPSINEPCDDAISRQAVLDLVNSDWKYEGLETDVASLPSVTQKSGKWIRVTDKTGHLVWECDKCSWQQRLSTNFCPDCGARMEGEE